MGGMDVSRIEGLSKMLGSNTGIPVMAVDEFVSKPVAVDQAQCVFTPLRQLFI
jgi:hypothetical protein